MQNPEEFISAVQGIDGVAVHGNTITVHPKKSSGAKLRVNRRGDGYVTNYTVSIGSAEARRAGFLNDDGTSKILEKIVDEDAHTITLRIIDPAL